MFDNKKLTEEQIAAIKSWAAEGAQLPDIQKKMEQELGVCLTYMDTRFLVLDLNIELRNLEEEAEDAEKEVEPRAQVPEEQLAQDDLEVLPPTPQGSGAVSVTVDSLARPGLMASGRVTFADSQAGMWYVDEMGRLGIDPDTAGYRPTEADLQAFQRELQRVMETK